MTDRKRLLSAAVFATAAALALGGCKTSGEIVVDQDVGITAVRGACPAVGIPEYTGDVTTFRVPGSTLASDIDVVAAMTDVRSTCGDNGPDVITDVTFQVLARRAKAEYLVGTEAKMIAAASSLLPFRTFDKAVRKQILGS
jgi:hypothetical protein